MEVVYHSSPVRNLDPITPQKSKHGVPYVYAAHAPIFSLLFLHHPIEHFGSSMIDWGRMGDPKEILICERVPGSFKAAYEGASGSLYHLPKAAFSSIPRDWPEEVVSAHPVSPVKEIPMDNVAAEITKMASHENVRLYLYPERPPHTPSDDADLVYSALSAAVSYGPSFLTPLEALHPHLFQAAQEILCDPRVLHRFENSLKGFCSPQDIVTLEQSLQQSGRKLLKAYRRTTPARSADL